ncbi:SIS domain-containing protein [Enterococcus gilvus]|uniref:MurR/RpiR family transcriptional regulator n=1 Tax=Enterococcus gilvus TaxID=160453 RepID=UPI00290C92C5|nr:SIS domain-containing protein [Enterococcus gilvus]MDU5510858.1 SIS domain-containing protein [Enterococcus gilvus]
MKIYHISKLLPDNTLREEDEEIIEYIVKKIEKDEEIDIRSTAMANFTSPSSISRLAKRAGFNNFKEMIFYLTQKFNESQIAERSVSQQKFLNTKQNWEEIDRIFEVIKEQGQVYLSGEGFCDLLVKYAYRKLMLKKIYAIDLKDMEIKLISDGQPKSLIIFSQSGENRDGIRRIKECKELGGKAITFTAAPNSTFLKEGDASFQVDPESTVINSENSTLNFFFGNCLNAVEYLFDRYL